MDAKAMIGRAVRRERERSELSLSALAAQAGVAKSTLSQLESGAGNPNVETLWSIATALNVPFAQLFENTEPREKLVRRKEGESVTAAAGEFAAVLLDAAVPSMRRDLYKVHLSINAPRNARPHASGTVEHAVLCDGRIKIGPDDATEILEAGDYYRFAADVPHSYEALTETALLLLIMESPR